MTKTKEHSQPAKPAKDTVYVDIEDDITTIIAKVEAAQEKIVALVLPKRSTVLQSTVNMRLLKRSADNAGKSLVLITSDASITPLAGVAGLHIAKNLSSRPEIPGQSVDKRTEADEEDIPTTLDHHRAVGELAAVSALDEPQVLDMGETEVPAGKKEAKPAKDKRLKVPDFDKFRLRLVIFAAVGVIALVLLVLAVFVLPKATITVKTGSVDVSADFNLTTSGNAEALDMEKLVIPAAEQSKDQTVEESVPATGERNDGEKASGSVTFTAQKCSGNPFDVPAAIPAGTGISRSGLTYVTNETTNFQGTGVSGSCYNYEGISDTGITAQEAGSQYNTSNATFSVYGRSDASANGSASGGTDDITKIVSQADLDKVKQKITTESSDKFSQDFQQGLDEQGLFVIDETLKLSEPKVSSSPKVGEPASNVNVTVKVNYKVLTVKKDDLSKAVTEELNKQMDTSKQKLATDDVLEGIIVDSSDQKNATTMILNISQTVAAVPIINENEVKVLAAGQKSSTIKTAIGELPGVEEVVVDMSPFWVSVAPKKPSKITVIQEPIATDQPPANQQTTEPEGNNEQNP